MIKDKDVLEHLQNWLLHTFKKFLHPNFFSNHSSKEIEKEFKGLKLYIKLCAIYKLLQTIEEPLNSKEQVEQCATISDGILHILAILDVWAPKNQREIGFELATGFLLKIGKKLNFNNEHLTH